MYLMYHESDPGQVGYATFKRLHGNILLRLRGLPGLADFAGHPTYRVNMIKLK